MMVSVFMAGGRVSLVVPTVTSHTGEDVVHQGRAYGQKGKQGPDGRLGRVGAREPERQPSQESDHPGDKDHHDEGPGRIVALRTEFHGGGPDKSRAVRLGLSTAMLYDICQERWGVSGQSAFP